MLSMVVVLGCCLGVAASASAEGGPLFGYLEGGVAYLLQPGWSLSVLASAVNTQVLRSNGVEITCSALKLLPGAYLAGGSPGKDLEQILYSGCSVSGSPNCDVLSQGEPLGAIQTEPLESELVFLSETAAIELDPDESGTLFKPQNTTEKFVTIQTLALSSGACPAAIAVEPTVKGLVILENDEPLIHKELHLLLAPQTLITSYFLGHTGEEKAVKTLKAFGATAKYLGKVSVDVTLLGGSTNLSWWLCP
jgi:hypothetical protein